MTKATRIALVSIVLGIAVGAGLLVGAESIAFNGGPLQVPPEQGWVLPAEQGHRFTDGFEDLRVDGDREIILESIEDVGGEGLRLLGAQIAGPEREHGLIQYMRGYPPREPSLGPLIPALGARLSPDEMPAELLLGYEVVSRGRLIREGLRITYRVGRRRYVQEFPSTLIVCTPEAQTPKGECPLPEDV